jgi:hypothetical protein
MKECFRVLALHRGVGGAYIQPALAGVSHIFTFLFTARGSINLTMRKQAVDISTIISLEPWRI